MAPRPTLEREHCISSSTVRHARSNRITRACKRRAANGVLPIEARLTTVSDRRRRSTASARRWRVLAPALLRFGAFDEIGGADMECLGEAADQIQARVALPSLQAGDVGAVDDGLVGKPLLAPALLVSVLAHLVTEVSLSWRDTA